MLESIYTRWPPCEENEDEVVVATLNVYLKEGAQAAVDYVRKHYLVGSRTRFAGADGNILMAKLVLLLGDTEEFLEFRNAAVSLGGAHDDLVKLGEMFSRWTKSMARPRWLPIPHRWRLVKAAMWLQDDYLPYPMA